MGTILGIDLGTSACKAVLLDHDGGLLYTATIEVYPRTTTGGMVELDPDEWYRAAATGLRQLQSQGADLSAISAVGVTGQMQGVTVVDSSGNPVRDSLLWSDTRSEPQAQWLRDHGGDRIEETIGYPISPGLTITKLLWLQQNEPENWRRTATFLHAANFLISRLTDVVTADQNNLGQSGLNNFVRNDWSEEMLSLANIEHDKVPPLRGCFEVVGHVTTHAASETGLPVGIPVVTAGGDSAAESYSIALAGSDRMKIRLGTAGDMNVVVPFSSLDPAFLRGIRDVLPDHVLLGAYTRGCASSVRWARRLLYSELPPDEQAFRKMDEDAAGVPPGSDGLLYWPYLYGEATPYYNSHISGKFHGMRGGMERAHFARAVYEGVSLSLQDVLSKSSAFDFAQSVVVVGGGSKSHVWLSILADVIRRELVVPKNCDAAYGAALIAGEGTGAFNGREVAEANVADHRRIEPREETTTVYEDAFGRYLELAGR